MMSPSSCFQINELSTNGQHTKIPTFSILVVTQCAKFLDKNEMNGKIQWRQAQANNGGPR